MMRRLIPAAAALALFALPAAAQTQSAPATATATTPAAAAARATTHPRHHRTLQQHFAAANTTHDGHLTKDQAAAANWPYVVNNFAAIDKGRKGYVTVEDIHAFYRSRHAAHHHKATPASSPKPASGNG